MKSSTLFAVSVPSVWLIAALFSILFFSCKDDVVDGKWTAPDIENEIILLNEGGFQKGNASVSILNRETGVVSHDLFLQANGHPMGDVLNTAAWINDQWWWVLNNSGKIWITDDGLKVKQVLTGFTSPRYAVSAGPDKVYVSDLFSGFISIVNTSDGSISGKINMPGWSEQMVKAGGRVWVANKQSEYLYAIDPETDRIADSIRVRNNGGTLFMNANNKHMILFCEPEWDLSTPACIYTIDPFTAQRVDSLVFALGQGVWKVTGHPLLDRLYYTLDGKLYASAISQLKAGNSPVIDLQGKNIYALGLDPRTGDFYISDALDFSNRSEVHVYDSTGKWKSQFKAGVNCNGFRF